MDGSQQDISVTILGSGTCEPSLVRSSCSFMLKTDKNTLVFDMGPGTIRRLLEAGTKISQVSHIFLSHLHLDHTGDLAPFLFSTKYGPRQFRDSPLTIVAASGFSAFFNDLNRVYKDWLALPSQMINIIELDNKKPDHYEFEGFRVDSMPMRHREESIGYRITASNGTCVVYSGDTEYNENLVALAKDADLFICESAFPDGSDIIMHMTPSLAGKAASLANAAQLVLTHLYPSCDNTDIEAQCRKTYSGPLIIARDLLRIQPIRKNPE